MQDVQQVVSALSREKSRSKTRIEPEPVWPSGHNHNMISADCQIFPEIKIKGEKPVQPQLTKTRNDRQ